MNYKTSPISDYLNFNILRSVGRNVKASTSIIMRHSTLVCIIIFLPSELELLRTGKMT